MNFLRGNFMAANLIFIPSKSQEKCLIKNGHLTLAFVDFKKPFDYVNSQFSWSFLSLHLNCDVHFPPCVTIEELNSLSWKMVSNTYLSPHCFLHISLLSRQTHLKAVSMEFNYNIEHQVYVCTLGDFLTKQRYSRS